MKPITSVLLITAIGIAPEITFAQETGILDRQGVWVGGYKRGRSEEINFELKIVRDIGLLEVESRDWEPVGSAACQYVFDATQEASVKLTLNGSFGSPERCAQQFELSFSRASADSALLQFEGGNFLPEAELSAGLRPLRDVDRRSVIAGLDVLNIKPGMALEEAEDLLSNQQFSLMPEWTSVAQGRSGNWTQETRYYVRQEKENGEWGDFFVVQYSPNVEGAATERRVSMLSRGWEIPEDQAVTELTLLNALTEKYGPSLAVGEDREWDRTGHNLTELDQRRSNCAPGSLQEIPFSIDFRNSALTGC